MYIIYNPNTRSYSWDDTSDEQDRGLTIAAGVGFLFLGIALIIAGSLGVLPMLPTVICGAILTTTVLSVFAFHIIRHKLLSAKPNKEV